MKKKFFNKFKKPILIAEISSNHNGSFEHAKKLILCAKKNGADFVKLQTYKASTMTINSPRSEFKIKSGLWKNKSLWDLYKLGSTPYEWHSKLFDFAKKNKIFCFSTPFDETAVDLLESLNCPLYKISSFEMTDFPLIKKVAKTGKPLIISTGMAQLDEITETYNFAKKNGANEIALLYCVSNYPAKDEDFNLKNISILKNKFKCTVGFSDHSKNNNVAKTAISLGAHIVEKHIALENQKKGPDIDFSLKGKEIKKFRNDIDKIYQILGKNKFVRKKSENKSLLHRRSIYVIKNIKKGDKLSKQNIKCIRPNHGLAPLYYERILGKKILINLKYETPLLIKHISKFNGKI